MMTYTEIALTMVINAWAGWMISGHYKEMRRKLIAAAIWVLLWVALELSQR